MPPQSSTPLELTWPSLLDCPNPFPMIFSLKEQALLSVLVIGLGSHGIREPTTQGCSCGLDRKRSILRDLTRKLHRFFAQSIRLGQHIAKTPRDGLFAGYSPAGVEQQARLLNSNDSRQRVCQPKSRMYAELDEVRAKTRI